ncbi:MAG: DUF4912 domain-containing protein [Verrucomicrobia bacterium]|nr:DUF4912 domain-containing protein [Verrucomicrobiota bacterium]
MKLEKKPIRRVLKSPSLTRAPAAVVKAVPELSSKHRRTAKTATEAQPQGAPKAELAAKVRRPARPLASAMKSKRPSAPRKVRAPKHEIPPILLAGDTAAQAGVSGPGQRYALGPTSPPAHAGPVAERGELPETYGTAKLWLTARDPQWVYAHWDLSAGQQGAFNAQSDDGHLVVRVFETEILGEPLVTQHVHPESRNWFIHVGRGGTKFVAQLGYFDRKERWQTIALSAATVTPPDDVSADTSAEFATLPVEVPFEELVEMVRTIVGQHIPLMEALAQLREQGHPNLPTAETFAAPAAAVAARSNRAGSGAPQVARGEAAGPAPAPVWTSAQAEALAEVVTMDEVRRVWIGSMEITELVRRQLVKRLSEVSAAQMAAGQGSLGLGSPSSPFGALGSLAGAIGGVEKARGFWFNINAELILYGATEADAKVTIGGRQIRLRPDGTFSYRFALPDGTFDLPAIAISAAGDDTRAAELRFHRKTAYHGDVGAHPQDATLKAPTPDGVGAEGR